MNRIKDYCAWCGAAIKDKNDTKRIERYYERGNMCLKCFTRIGQIQTGDLTDDEGKKEFELARDLEKLWAILRDKN